MIDFSDINKLCEDVNKFSRKYAKYVTEEAEAKAKYEYMDSWGKTTLADAFNESGDGPVSKKEKEAYSSEKYKNFLAELANLRDKYYELRSKKEACRVVLEGKRAILSVQQSLIRVQ